MKPETLKKILPTALSFLPVADSQEAHAILIAIALQESGLRTRRQLGNGPARGYWQFEQIGVKGVLDHPSIRVKTMTLALCTDFDCQASAEALWGAIEHNDILAIAVARILLWTHPAPLPKRLQCDAAWDYYESLWRPGRPRPEKWDANWEKAWSVCESVTS